nr:MAG TPA: hypothetical protein [Microviridae sp.]DAP48423.1 MAG TPA: hypothetical protein [Microviridae sp.]DAP65669.1 MAG TPA: hypothetical protein [Microviridae sp.]
MYIAGASLKRCPRTLIFFRAKISPSSKCKPNN